KSVPSAPSQGNPPAPVAGLGPLAKFTRSGSASDQSAPAVEPAVAEPSSPPLPASSAPVSPPGPPSGPPPRAREERPKSRRQKERDEDKQLDRELAAERQLREERAARPPVPVPNRRQRSEELEAE